MKIMKVIEKGGKIYDCPLKSNHQVTQSPNAPYNRVDSLTWSEAELETGKMVPLKKFPKGHQLKLFRIVLSSQRTDYVVTNDPTQDSADATREESAIRWKIE